MLKLHVYYTFLIDICYNSIYYSNFNDESNFREKKEELNGKKESCLH